MEKFTIKENGCSAEETNGYPDSASAEYQQQSVSAQSETEVRAASSENEYTQITEKVFNLAGLEGKLNLKTSELVSTFCDVPAENSVMGLKISHSHKINCGEHLAGKNYVLSLNESLVKNENPAQSGNTATYLYTDCHGNVRGIGEYFYTIGANKSKEYVTKSNVEVKSDGSLVYNGKKVYTEYRSTTGLKLIAQVDTDGASGVFKNNKLFESRSDEEKQLAEQVKGYENALGDFVIAEAPTDDTTLSILNIIEITDFSAVMTELPANKYILPRAEALQCKSLNRQEDYLDSPSLPDNFPDHNKTISKAVASIEQSFQEISKKLMRYVTKTGISDSTNNEDIISALESGSGIAYSTIEEAFQDKPADEEFPNLKLTPNDMCELFRQRNLLLEQLQTQTSDVNYQKTTIKEQLDILANKRDYYIETARSYYKEYVNKKFALERLRNQTPVNFLTDGEIFKGFNKKGQLVVVFDSNENYAVVEYETCTKNSTEYDRISKVYDNNGKTVSFCYKIDNGLLESITDIYGNKTEYEYNSDDGLSKVTFPNGKYVSLSYTSDYRLFMTIESEDARVIFIDNTPFKILEFSLIKSVTKDGIVKESKLITQTDITFKKEGNSNVQADIISNDYKERFILDSDGELVEYYLEENGVVTKATKTSFFDSDNGSKTQFTHKTLANTLNKTPLKDFSLDTNGAEKIVQYNSSRKPYQIVSYKDLNIYDNTTNKQTTTTDITYDEEWRVIREDTKITTNNPATTTESYKTYAYNADGKLIRTESGVKGEELTLGKTVEQIFYDENGKRTKSCTYNSLDPSAKFWTETAVAESNQSKQSQAANKAKQADGAELNGAEPDSAAQLNYSAEGDVTAITQSTEEGEENSTKAKYTCGLITELTSGNTTVNYEYDYKRRPMAVHVNDTPDFVKYTYTDNETATVNGAEKKTDRVTATYAARNQTATPEVAESVSDKFGNLIKTSHNETVQFENEYDAYGNVIRASDKITGETFNYSYDSLHKLLSVERKTGAQLNCIEEYSYNAEGQIISKSTNGGFYPQSYEYEYESNSLKRLNAITYNGNFRAELKYDLLGRNAGKEITFPNSGNGTVIKQKVTYIKHGDKATNLPCKVEYVTAGNDGNLSSENIRYAYDKRGNIEKVYKNGKLTQRYKYDSLNRLIREDNREFKKTYLLAYDDNGNIISKRSMTFNLLGEEHIEERFDTELAGGTDNNGMPISPTATEEIFNYDGDKLVKYGGNSFTYDSLGCPSSYNGNECEWSFGRLKRYGSINFTYDGYGRRISRGNTTYTYDSEGRLQSQNCPEGNFSFIYDESGIAGIEYSSEKYIFCKDSQGNVTAILNGNGNVEAKYVYDAWGNCKVLDSFGNEIWDMFNIGVMNPIRYRSYYYDTETNLYYLNTRYYDPTPGRFISPDSLEYIDPETINGLNLYAYCGNNPVMNVDPNGTAFWDILAEFFLKIGSAFVNFATNSLFKGVVKPAYNIAKSAYDWVSNVGYPAVNNFFTNTVPNFFTNTVPDFFVNTVWNDWIVGTVWNNWIVDKLWNNGILVAWNWLFNTKEGRIIFSVWGIVLSVVGAVISAITCPTPVAPLSIAGLAASKLALEASILSLIAAITS